MVTHEGAQVLDVPTQNNDSAARLDDLSRDREVTYTDDVVHNLGDEVPHMDRKKVFG